MNIMSGAQAAEQGMGAASSSPPEADAAPEVMINLCCQYWAAVCTKAVCNPRGLLCGKIKAELCHWQFIRQKLMYFLIGKEQCRLNG